MSEKISINQLLIWATVTTALYLLLYDFMIEIPMIGFFFIKVGWLVPLAFWYGVFTGK